MLTRLGPPLTILLLAGPILAGLLGTILPAFGYLPATGSPGFSLDSFATLFAQPGILASAAMSFVVGLASAGVSLLVVMLFVAAWAGTRAFARLQHLVSPLLAVPHAAAAFGFAFLIAPSGMLSRLVSPELTGWERPPDLLVVNDPMGISLTAGLVAKEIPFLLLITLAALPQLRLAETRALAAALGYGRVAGFLHGLWPPLYRQIRLGCFAVIAFASSVVDVAAILGPTAPAPLAVQVVTWMNDPDLSTRGLAAAGALLQLAVTGFALLAWMILERLASAAMRRLAFFGRRFRHDAALRHAAFAAMALAAGAVFAGLGTLALWSVAGLWQFPNALPETLNLNSWARALPRIAEPLWTTLALASSSSLMAVLLAILCLRNEDRTGRRAGRGALLLLYLPLLVPQVAFLFGLQLLFVATGSVASFAALALAHLVFVLPYVFLSLSDPWRAFDRRYEAIAAGLGRSGTATLLRIRLPMLLRAILTAGAIGFAVSVGLYLPTLLIGAGRLPTVTTEAVALASGGNRRVIGVYAFLQMLLPALGFLVATLVPALIFRRSRALRV